MAERQITVYANPYCALHDGEPHGVVQMVAADGYGMAGRWVGAVPDHEGSKAADRHIFKFLLDEDGKPVATRVPFVGHAAAYYAKKVLEGELLAGNVEDAILCGIARSDYVDPLKQLEAEKALAAAKHVAHFGDDKRPAWAPSGDLPMLTASVVSPNTPAPPAKKADAKGQVTAPTPAPVKTPAIPEVAK